MIETVTVFFIHQSIVIMIIANVYKTLIFVKPYGNDNETLK